MDKDNYPNYTTLKQTLIFSKVFAMHFLKLRNQKYLNTLQIHGASFTQIQLHCNYFKKEYFKYNCNVFDPNSASIKNSFLSFHLDIYNSHNFLLYCETRLLGSLTTRLSNEGIITT